ncbi:ribonuclease III domain-containing protein [Podospora didyma]|uniref:Large ribosomal subunit protein mL44 n=1 Tax=Podospora didyma TaxID=330526 RepID=A0AAE0NZB6_9PEZI|nr:ribonuclease III domain-containing protein [Podospora didyma]
MKRIRADRWTGQLLAARPLIIGGHSSCRASASLLSAPTRSISSSATSEAEPYDDGTDHTRFPPLERLPNATTLPSPLPERALRSAKLAALHARLSLSQKVPLQTLARTLVDGSADANRQFNNTNLAFVGQTIINYHVTEWLMCRYPRLPMDILYAALAAFAADDALFQVAKSWGIESAAAPGGEVDPGLLQFSLHKPSTTLTQFGYQRTEMEYIEKYKWRRGINSRVMFDDDFGQMVSATPGSKESEEQKMWSEVEAGLFEKERKEMVERSDTEYGTVETRALASKAHAHFTRAVVGAVYAHCGREAGKAFIKSHILSRTLDVSKLFAFKTPTRELALLCAREDFEPPVARLLSETGRLSRTPVFVVGIFSGKDKLGEGVGPNLDHARWKAAMNALKSWYLYSPGDNVRVPSDMLVEGAKPWEPTYIDLGEVISR